jgi:hypothetical protein
MTQAPIFPHGQTKTPSLPDPQPPQHQQQQRTYANVVSNTDKTAEEQISPLKSLIDEFKTLITQLINQNTMILPMLTTLINTNKTYKILRIAHWNANGLQKHREEIKLFLSQNQIDIMLVSETHFTTKSYFSIPGYSICQTNNPDGKAHGGQLS